MLYIIYIYEFAVPHKTSWILFQMQNLCNFMPDARGFPFLYAKHKKEMEQARKTKKSSNNNNNNQNTQ